MKQTFPNYEYLRALALLASCLNGCTGASLLVEHDHSSETIMGLIHAGLARYSPAFDRRRANGGYLRCRRRTLGLQHPPRSTWTEAVRWPAPLPSRALVGAKQQTLLADY